MTHQIGIVMLIALCGCSIDSVNPDPSSTDTDTDPGTSEPPSPDAETLPTSARLVPEPVDSVEDLPGRWAQPFALPGQVSVINLDTPNLGTGSYQLYRSCGLPTCVPESGQYHVVPTNPAIGFAALSLVDQTGLVRSTYILDLLWRDAEGTLVAVQLRALLGSAPGLGNGTGPTQVWWRVPDNTTDAPVAPAMGTPSDESALAVMAAPAGGSGKPSMTGVFVRPLPVYGDIGAITIDDTVWFETTAVGPYEASYPYCLPWCIPEGGGYELDLSNVATGTGRLSLVPAGNPTQAHDYVVYAIWRGLDGVAAAIQLQRVDGVVPSGPPFTMYRQWWTGSTAAAVPANPVTCGTYLSLAQYYQIRALQCGMGACWPLSPWYASWAQYYQGLADAAGCSPS